ncbi:transposase [Embleya sp. NPDC050493]|uniref:transposase n=1 Tax=Embleya sp. NPDC050493 TaxID=3363989 RepID=UPI00379906D2
MRSDEDFAGWYPHAGRPGISRAQPATVGVLQFLLGLSDRRAAEAVRRRIDFEYAMASEPDDPGFTTAYRPTSGNAPRRTTAPTLFSTWRSRA